MITSPIRGQIPYAGLKRAVVPVAGVTFCVDQSREIDVTFPDI